MVNIESFCRGALHGNPFRISVRKEQRDLYTPHGEVTSLARRDQLPCGAGGTVGPDSKDCAPVDRDYMMMVVVVTQVIKDAFTLSDG